MKCLNCNKELSRHSNNEIDECLSNLGIEKGSKTPVEIATILGLSIKINYRHKVIFYNGQEIKTDNIDKEILCLCLANAPIVKPVIEEKKRDEEEEKPIEPINPWYTPFGDEKDDDGEPSEI